MAVLKYDELLFNRYFEDWSKLPSDKIISLLTVKAAKVLPSLKDIDFSKKLHVKLGFDPTGPEIHISHVCPLIILNIFLKCGHHIDFIIGDFTSTIGDPSERQSERPILTDDQIMKNFATYRDQVNRYIDTSKLVVHRNSTWLSKVTGKDLLSIWRHFNLAQILQRDDFRKRLADGGLTQAEICYSTFQALDSVNLKSDIELGGVDQLLNLQTARDVQRLYGQKPEVIITNGLLEGTDGTGRKMGKSYNNYIAVNAPLDDKFGKIMSIPDSLLMQYYKSFAYLYENELAALEKFCREQPMEAKKQLATYFTAIEAKSLAAGQTERTKFENKFAKKELTDDDYIVVKVKSGTTLLDALMQSGKFASKGDLKRLLASNAIKTMPNGTVVSIDSNIVQNTKIKVGKLNFINIVIK